SLHGPPRGIPGSDVEDVTSINNVGSRDQLSHGFRVKVAEFLPFGRKDYQFSFGKCLGGTFRVAECWEDLAGVLHAVGVIDGDCGAAERQGACYRKRRGIADVVRVGLEGTT